MIQPLLLQKAKMLKSLSSSSSSAKRAVTSSSSASALVGSAFAVLDPSLVRRGDGQTLDCVPTTTRSRFSTIRQSSSSQTRTTTTTTKRSASTWTTTTRSSSSRAACGVSQQLAQQAISKENRLLVVGSGVAGSATALVAAETYKIPVTLLFAGNHSEDCNSNWAQGGIIYRNYDTESGDSADLLAQDIHRAGAGLCQDDAVRKVAEEGPDRVRQLLLDGNPFATVPFDKRPDGSLSLCLGKCSILASKHPIKNYDVVVVSTYLNTPSFFSHCRKICFLSSSDRSVDSYRI